MQVKINDDKKEIKSHGSYEFPLAVYYEEISKYDRGGFVYHWHPEVEFTIVLSGEMEYRINNDIYYIKKGEGLFGNTNTLHMGHMFKQNKCNYAAITFNPKIIYGYKENIIKKKYIDKIFGNNDLPSMHLKHECIWQRSILEDLEKICKLYDQKNETYEMQIQVILINIMMNIYINTKNEIRLSSNINTKDIERLKVIISFINENYNKKITLEDIASQINICKSECCRFFKKNMKESLFNYLLNYRIEKSLSLLHEDKYNITQIAELVGFSSSAYFTKIFKRQMLCSPREYKSKKIELFNK